MVTSLFKSYEYHASHKELSMLQKRQGRSQCRSLRFCGTGAGKTTSTHRSQKAFSDPEFGCLGTFNVPGVSSDLVCICETHDSDTSETKCLPTHEPISSRPSPFVYSPSGPILAGTMQPRGTKICCCGGAPGGSSLCPRRNAAGGG